MQALQHGMAEALKTRTERVTRHAGIARKRSPSTLDCVTNALDPVICFSPNRFASIVGSLANRVLSDFQNSGSGLTQTTEGGQTRNAEQEKVEVAF